MSRIAGADRYATAVALAKAAYPGTADLVFITTGTNYPDALATGPVAAKLGAPLLLTDSAELPASVGAEITSLAPTTVVIVGGLGAVSAAVVSEIAAAAPNAAIDPISGSDRFATAVDVVKYGFASAPTVYLATGDNYPDALSAAAAAGDQADPVVLVDGSASTLSPNVKDLLSSRGTTKVIIVGGTAAVSSGIQSSLNAVLGSSNVSRLAGADRYATSSLVETSTFSTSTSAYLATGMNYPDALTGSAFAGQQERPLLLVASTCVPTGTLSALSRLGVVSATLIGGTGAVSDGVTTLATCANLPAHPSVSPATVLAPASIDGLNWPFATFDRIDCVASSSCVAVGHWYPNGTTNVGRGLVATYVNGVWHSRDAPLPSDAASNPMVQPFTALTCVSSTNCEGASEYTNRNGQTVGFVEELSGANWIASGGSMPDGTASGATTVSATPNCASDGFCASFDRTTTAPGTALLTTWGNGTSVVVPAPLPANAYGGGSYLEAIQCTSSSYCVAVGTYTALSDGYPGSTTVDDGMIETFANGVWTVTEGPTPSGEELVNTSNLNDVSCVADGVCEAVGYNNFWDPSIAVTGYGVTVDTIRP